MVPSKSTKSDGTPRGGYERPVRTRGCGAKNQREAMIQKKNDGLTEMAMK